MGPLEIMKRINLVASIVILLFFFTGCELKENKVYYYEITIRNAGEKDIRGVIIKTGTESNMFGFAPSGAPDKGATAAGCAISFNGATKIVWEDDTGKEHEYDIKLKEYYSRRKKIKGFLFTYIGNNKWTIKTGTFLDGYSD